eukprot:7227427-Pyramimonas_sp.AAC.2
MQVWCGVMEPLVDLLYTVESATAASSKLHFLQYQLSHRITGEFEIRPPIIAISVTLAVTQYSTVQYSNSVQ